MTSSPAPSSAGQGKPVQTWDPALYDARHSFVYKAAADMLGLLAPQSGEKIVDLGCGTGPLTAQIAAAGAHVIGLDSSEAMIREAQRNFPTIDFRVADARSFTVAAPQDAVFSNAVLHWVQPPEQAISAIAAALRPGGRFVAEFGGHGCVSKIISAANRAIADADVKRQWFFPSVGEYTPLLEAGGFEVRFATLFDRPTPLDEGEQGLRNWLRMFAGAYFDALEENRREATFAAIENELRDELWKDGRWVADYRRIRIVAYKL
jgi:trans-aconitate methyltransferase